MKAIYVGIDVSKGYMDAAAVNESGSVLWQKGPFDDNRKGHDCFMEILQFMMKNKPFTRLVVGVESTGGLERNWAAMIRKSFPNARMLLLNPLAVKKFGERGLHRSVTDRISALNIAHYLRLGIDPDETCREPVMEGPVSFYRHVRKELCRIVEMKNELRSLIARANPELEQYCRNGIPGWVLTLLQKHPTAQSLARARAGKIAMIPHVNRQKAESLIAEAKESVASQQDPYTAMTVKDLCKKIERSLKDVEKMKKVLTDDLQKDETVKVWTTFPGVGAWTASALRLEFGAIERFYSSEAAVAYSGLDPAVSQSGDGVKNHGISKKGRRQIRGILYPAALSAIRCNAVIKEFYHRLRSRGKVHLEAATACMRKMVSILYATALTGKPFDPEYQQLLQEKMKQKTEEESQSAPDKEQPEPSPALPSLKAPISRREAKKRREKIAKLTAVKRKETEEASQKVPEKEIAKAFSP